MCVRLHLQVKHSNKIIIMIFDYTSRVDTYVVYTITTAEELMMLHHFCFSFFVEKKLVECSFYI